MAPILDVWPGVTAPYRVVMVHEHTYEICGEFQTLEAAHEALKEALRLSDFRQHTSTNGRGL